MYALQISAKCLACLTLIAAMVACSEEGSDANAEPPTQAFNYQYDVIDVDMVGKSDSQPAVVNGLPKSGVTITVNR